MNVSFNFILGAFFAAKYIINVKLYILIACHAMWILTHVFFSWRLLANECSSDILNWFE